MWESKHSGDSEQSRKILIYGTGRMGTSIINLIVGGLNGVVSLGFLDDDADLKGRYIKGYKVLGHESDIPTIHEVHNIDEIWLSFLPDGLKRNRLNKICSQLNIELIALMETEPFLRFISDIREHKRCYVGVNLPCVISKEDKKFTGKVRNVGLGGIEAELKQSFFTDNNINIHFNLLSPGQYKQTRLITPAKIIWKFRDNGNYRYGLKFVNIEEKQMDVLKKYVNTLELTLAKPITSRQTLNA
jgi:hypothetical protein